MAIKLQYLPVIFNNKYNWWEAQFGQTMMYGLLSAGDAYYGMKSDNTFRKPEGMELYVDSGGYQIVTQEAFLKPEEVARWQDSVDGDVKITLDHPPRYVIPDTDTVIYFHGDKFDACLDETCTNSKILDESYTKQGKFYGVLHGIDKNGVTKWFEKLNSVCKFDGWCISIARKAADPFELKMKILGENGVKRIHLLGESNFKVLVRAAILMRRYGIEFCTFDSTRYIATKFSNIFYPTIENFVTWFARTDNKPNLRLACDCPVCRALKPNEALERGDEVEFGYIVSMHNIYHTQRISDVAAELSKYPETYKELEKLYDNIKLPILLDLAPQLSEFK